MIASTPARPAVGFAVFYFNDINYLAAKFAMQNP